MPTVAYVVVAHNMNHMLRDRLKELVTEHTLMLGCQFSYPRVRAEYRSAYHSLYSASATSCIVAQTLPAA